MNARGFENWMDRHGLSPRQAAEYLGVDRKTVDRFVSGDLVISARTSAACRALDPVRLWRLTPVDLNHNDWRASSFKGEVIVRAQGEMLARWQAAKKFHVQARRRSDAEDTPENPWLNPRRVDITSIAPTDEIATAGQPGVVG